jgi:hypothetical protein
MNPLSNNEDCDFAKYFKNLGYGYSWDWSKRDGLQWHELFKDGKLVLQVEMIDLNQIIKDMCIVEDVELDYFIAGGHGSDREKNYKELCDKVRDFEKKKNAPVAQLDGAAVS